MEYVLLEAQEAAEQRVVIVFDELSSKNCEKSWRYKKYCDTNH